MPAQGLRRAGEVSGIIPFGGRNGASPASPRTAHHMANERQKGEVDDNIPKARFVSGELPIIKTPNQRQIWQLKRMVLGSVLVSLEVSQPGWQDTCKYLILSEILLIFLKNSKLLQTNSENYSQVSPIPRFPDQTNTFSISEKIFCRSLPLREETS